MPLLALCWQPEQPWKSHEEQPVPSPAKAFVACVLIACHWKFASLGTLWEIFGLGVGRVFALQMDHAIGPCHHPSVHTTCCLWVRMESFQCWKAEIPEQLPFPSCFDFVAQGLVLFSHSQNCEHKFQQCKKKGAFPPFFFFP